MMTIRLGMNMQDIETIGVINRGPVKGSEGEYAYEWGSTNGRRGRVVHHREAGAAALGATVLLDRITRKADDEGYFSLSAIEELDTDEMVFIEGGDDAA